ncbi:hypothetical protein [Actinomadura madurae]|uniref:hypothetical protein n=1 Tax=Actinomadura madurae TaxID=1993 RepID=UPI0020270DB2|nr:hypothetical protein [Actinomadura madurae]MCP9953718.1 hypothetical protein [Actinomadura madurae]MCP9970473.1 hypothetical protein [Actinomadura madurae]MCP9982954.1 hypothetical protein [Actinomadura madurae]MCQ0005497.1 hypothetical protein [Actinomadura madurae]URN09886.1 hypothetical protein LUW74_45430 [Actinomadura madurae]
MGLQRPVEPFHRPYAGPEPPAPARRPKRLLVLLVGVVAFAVAAVTVFLMAPGRRDGGTDRAAVTPRGSASAPAAPMQQGRVVKALPAPCGTVSAATVEKAVPKASKRQNANSTLTTCTFSSTGSAFRWLRVEAHLYAPADTATPVQDAEGFYDAQWAQAHDAPLVRTITLERATGIGDEAYRWFKADEGQPTVVGQVTARIRNAVFTVSYSERAPAAAQRDARERACLATATAAAREVLAALNHF